MKNPLQRVFLSLAVLLAPCLAQANVLLSFGTPSQSGNSLSIALIVSGLESGNAPSLGAYDLDIGFDPAHLDFAGAEFGDPALGDQLDLFDFGTNPAAASLSTAGIVNLFELSLDTEADLDDLQADSFTLATLTFDILQTGTSQLDISISALSDASGESFSASTHSVQVATVPLPPAFMLLISGMGMLSLGRSSKR